MAINQLYIPLVNPIKFYETDRATIDKYFTKHFDYFLFKERLYPWQQREGLHQIWQTTDIINLQFEASFDSLVVSLLDQDGNEIIVLPALMGLPNKYEPNLFAFEVNMSLAGLAQGCYFLQLTAGTGAQQKVLISNCQAIHNSVIENSLLLEYWNSRFHEDIVFETGIQFQYRIFGIFGFLDPVRKDDQYKDQRYNPALLTSRTSRQWPVHFGDERGVTDEEVDLLNRIWSCDNVLIDGLPFGIADGSKFEFTSVEGGYPKRGLKITVEAGINRNSRIFTLDTDTTKKLVSTIIVDAAVFGDTSNQGMGNTVPVYNYQE